MALEFDVTSTPPSIADILAEREYAVSYRVAIEKKNIRFLVVAGTLLLSIVLFQLFIAAPAAGNDSTDPTLVGIIALYTPYIIGAYIFSSLTLHHKMIENPRKDVRTTLASLEEVTPEEMSAIAGAAQDNSDVAAYREKVAAQGRPLVRAELDAIQRRLKRANRPPDAA